VTQRGDIDYVTNIRRSAAIQYDLSPSARCARANHKTNDATCVRSNRIRSSWMVTVSRKH